MKSLWITILGIVLCAGLILSEGTNCRKEKISVPEGFAAQVKADTEDSKRSPHWSAVEKAFKNGGTVNIGTREVPNRVTYSAHPFCAYCGSTLNVQIHHIHQFRDMTPEQKGANVENGELFEGNLISLCENPPDDHHLRIGHLGNFKTSNPNVVEDCRKHREELQSQGKWTAQ